MDYTTLCNEVSETKTEVREARKDLDNLRDAVDRVIPLIITRVVTPLVVILAAAYGVGHVMGGA